MANQTEESLLQQTGIDTFEIERRKELFGFGPADSAVLLQARPLILPALDAIAEEFYRIQTKNEDIALIIGDSETRRRLHFAQRNYLDDLFSGIYDNTELHTKMREALGFSEASASASY